MDLDNGIIIEILLPDLILLMVRVTRIVGALLSEINFLTERVEGDREVITPTHEMETGKVIEASLDIHTARENTLLKTTESFNHDPSK